MATAASRLTASATHSPSVVITPRRQFGPGHRRGPGSPPVWSRFSQLAVLAIAMVPFVFSALAVFCYRRFLVSAGRCSAQVCTGRLRVLVGQLQRQRQQHPRPSWPRGVPTRRKPCFQPGRPRDSGPTGNLLSLVQRQLLSSFFGVVFVCAQSGFGLECSPLPSMVLPLSALSPSSFSPALSWCWPRGSRPTCSPSGAPSRLLLFSRFPPLSFLFFGSRSPAIFVSS